LTGDSLSETTATLASPTTGWQAIRCARAPRDWRGRWGAHRWAASIEAATSSASAGGTPALSLLPSLCLRPPRRPRHPRRLDFWQGTGVGGVQLSWSATGLRIGGSQGSLMDRQIVASSNLYTTM
jgi:hypothetical protein